jgi:hypothetical protein
MEAHNVASCNVKLVQSRPHDIDTYGSCIYRVKELGWRADMPVVQVAHRLTVMLKGKQKYQMYHMPRKLLPSEFGSALHYAELRSA